MSPEEDDEQKCKMTAINYPFLAQFYPQIVLLVENCDILIIIKKSVSLQKSQLNGKKRPANH